MHKTHFWPKKECKKKVFTDLPTLFFSDRCSNKQFFFWKNAILVYFYMDICVYVSQKNLCVCVCDHDRNNQYNIKKKSFYCYTNYLAFNRDI